MCLSESSQHNYFVEKEHCSTFPEKKNPDVNLMYTTQNISYKSSQLNYQLAKEVLDCTGYLVKNNKRNAHPDFIKAPTLMYRTNTSLHKGSQI